MAWNPGLEGNSLPEPMWTYRMALLYVTEVLTCWAIAQACQTASHDQLTRLLIGPWSGHTRLDLALRTLFQGLGGELTVDDTVGENP